MKIKGIVSAPVMRLRRRQASKPFISSITASISTRSGLATTQAICDYRGCSA